MPNDHEILTRSFVGEVQPSTVSYHVAGPQSFRPIPYNRQALHLQTIFPWLDLSGWPDLMSNSVNERVRALRSDTDGIFLLPWRKAVLRGGRTYDPILPSYNAYLDIVLARMRAVLPRVDIHIGSCDPCHIVGNTRTIDALAHHEGLFAGYDVCPIVTQLGRMYQSTTPWGAMEQFSVAPILEFGAEPARVGIILAMHYLESGYLPDMDVECPGAAYDFRGTGKVYDDCPRWHTENGSYLALDWNYGSRTRPGHGTASMFTEYPERGSAR